MKTRKAPWDYDRVQVRLPINDIQLEYCMLVNKMEREYGIDYIANILKARGPMDWQEKLDHAKVLEHDLAQGCTCLPDLPDGRVNGGRGGLCPVCTADSANIPFEGGGL